MPPIPVHLDDPITPVKADGVTPQTVDQAANPSHNPPTTTIPAQPPANAYPLARPGAAAVPAPTPYVAQPPPAPSRTIPAHENGPPPPQPGAMPVPFSRQVTSTQLPPPPRVGESLQQQLQQQTPATTGPPPQVAIPPPQANQAPTHSTTYQPLVAPGPTTLNLGPATSLAQPADSQTQAGYHQNTMAQEMSAAQRGGQEKQGGTAGGGDIWGVLRGAVEVVGQKLAETEEAVWRGVGGGK